MNKLSEVIATTTLLISIAVTLSTCGPQQSVPSYSLSATPLGIPQGNSKEVAWLTDDLIAFLYLPPSIKNTLNLWEWQIFIYSLSQRSWMQIEAPNFDSCFSAWYHNLSRTPDQRLGFIVHCNLANPENSTETLYLWDPRTGEFQVAHQYSSPFLAGAYTFSPDMSMLIQENSVGAGLENQLYVTDAGGELSRLFEDWQRVKEPAWSQAGREVVFVGTQDYDNPNGTTTFSDIERLFRYPWSLYLMTADHSQVELVLPNVADRNLKWLPQGDWLSASGEYADQAGLWLINVRSKEVRQLWPQMASYDWSPDGKRLIILDQNLSGNSEVRFSAIVELPESFP